MKVSIYESVEVTDEQRKSISKTLGVKQATRDQLKEFIWKHGEQWALAVDGAPGTEDLLGDDASTGEPAQADDLADLI